MDFRIKDHHYTVKNFHVVEFSWIVAVDKYFENLWLTKGGFSRDFLQKSF